MTSYKLTDHYRRFELNCFLHFHGLCSLALHGVTLKKLNNEIKILNLFYLAQLAGS